MYRDANFAIDETKYKYSGSGTRSRTAGEPILDLEPGVELLENYPGSGTRSRTAGEPILYLEPEVELLENYPGSGTRSRTAGELSWIWNLV